MKTVLILCTGNSCRSQMAEAIWRAEGGDGWEAHSAGTHPAGFVHPGAVAAVAEIGLDLSGARSKSLDEFTDRPVDLVITVCDGAHQECPTLPGAGETLHWPFEDPAFATGTLEERATAFRQVRDQIRERIRTYLRPD